MMRFLSPLVVLAGCWVCSQLARAAEPELLPAPQLLTAPDPGSTSAPLDLDVSEYHRISRYAVWQNYGVDSRGVFRPLVVLSPTGSFYRFNGQPYHYLTVEPRVWMPFAVD